MSEFVIREFYGNEVLPYKKLFSYLFRKANKELENEEEYIAKLIDEDKNRDKDFVRLGAFFDDVLYAAIEMIPYDVYFDGKICKMYGIGGVISSPEAPKKGAVKLLFSEGFKIMQKKGIYLSHLYPFEVNYYRQYGYDVSATHTVWTVPITKITSFKKGELKSFNNSEKMKNEIIEIYNKFAENKNMAVVRNSEQWEKFFKRNKAYTTDFFSYVHYTDGTPDGFMSFFQKIHPTLPMNLVTDKLWFTSYDGLRGLISYFPTQKSYAHDAVLTLPSDIDLGALIDSKGAWGKRKSTKETNDWGTSRIVDAEWIFKNIRYNGEGQAAIKITDNYCPWNNDVFTVEFGKDVTVTRGGSPDIEMSINSFSSTILGRYDFDSCTIFDDVKIYGNEENLRKIFFKKKCYIEETF